MKIPKLTNAQKLLLTAVFSLVVSALSAALSAINQRYAMATGSVNISELLIVGLTTFGVSFGAGLYVYIPGHIPDELQALKDSMAELKDAMQPRPGNGAPPKPIAPDVAPPPTNG